MRPITTAPATPFIKVVRPSWVPRYQRGVSLLELMVGVAIGLLVVAVAMGALMVSRGVSGTVSDASAIQQQAAYAMRVIGLQLRQAGSLYLNPNSTDTAASEVLTAPVAFEAKADPPSGSSSTYSFDPSTDTISGTSSPATLTIAYRRFTESVHANTTEQTISRNCLGGPSDDTAPRKDDQRVESAFRFDATKNELRCGGNGATDQPIVQNVADFQVRYLLQDNSNPADTRIQYVDASAVGSNWSRVQAVEVCLVLYGSEPIDMPAGSTYTGCGNDATPANNLVDMTTLTGARARRMHIAFRNVFQLRSQGLVGTVL